MANKVFTQITDPRDLSSNSWANTFHLARYLDSAGNTETIANIFNSLTVRGSFLDDYQNYEVYEIEQKDTWEGISYNTYGSVNLWWLLCLVNEIQDPFEQLEVGKRIKLIKASVVNEVLYQIEKERLG